MASEQTTKAPYFFSVCIETDNRESTIVEVLQHVLDQSCQDFELIVVDNDSTDNTFRLLQNQLTNFDSSRLLLLKADHTKDEMVKWNRPITHARGRYIAICEGDDYFSHNHLEIAKSKLEALAMHTANLYTTELEAFSEIHTVEEIDLPSGNMLKDLAAFKWCPAPSQVIFSRLIQGRPFLFDVSAKYAGEYSLYEKYLSSEGNLIRNEQNTVRRGYRFYPKNYVNLIDAVDFYSRNLQKDYFDKQTRMFARNYLASNSLYFFFQQLVYNRVDFRLIKTFIQFSSIFRFKEYISVIRGSVAYSRKMKGLNS